MPKPEKKERKYTAGTGITDGKKIPGRNIYIGTCPNCNTKVFMFPHKQKINK